MDSQLWVTGEHGLLDESLPKHVQAIFAPIGVRAFFCQGGAVNHFPKKFSQVAQIFTKQSKGNESHTMH